MKIDFLLNKEIEYLSDIFSSDQVLTKYLENIFKMTNLKVNMLSSWQFQIALKRIICVEPGFVTIDFFWNSVTNKKLTEKIKKLKCQNTKLKFEH